MESERRRSLSEDDMLGCEDIFDMENVECVKSDSDELKCEIERAEKRKEPDNEYVGDWNIQGKKGKKYKKHVEKIEIYVSSSEPLPKQFALAKLLSANNITDVERVKYLSPFKVRIDSINELSAERLMNCKEMLEKGWRFQKAMEKNLSYGVIRDVDLDLTEEAIKSIAQCPPPVELLSAFRLNRRDSKGAWTRSESVRLCFKGSYLPSHVIVEGLTVRVQPYVFPVSQCSRCWHLGHLFKKCTSNKIVCPKCGENHETCHTERFKCINCNGRHMAMYKGCPAFLKEKKLREIMSEFNVTYRKALDMYVLPKSPSDCRPLIAPPPSAAIQPEFPPLMKRGTPSWACVTEEGKNKPAHKTINREDPDSNEPTPSTSSSKNQRRGRFEPEPYLFGHTQVLPTLEETHTEDKYTKEKRERGVHFSELISRLKEIIFMRGASIQDIVKSSLKCCVEWLILVLVDNVADWPVLKKVLDFITNYGL